ncbi:alpha/beta hydrolase [Sediminibacterium soli]|uniref:alpha/beta hydrolase n=1 Tax=Sediminibacterium soli TaxID=2698829 RepID=UPI00137B1B31|nr:alpha/beta fold hydrolase [Sediminibacterium soli]NCI47299.1 alpha/beta hydrolase [Sediminibacterium soli]
MKKKTVRLLMIPVVLYCLAGGILYVMQDRLLLHPQQVVADSSYRFGQPFTETNIESDKETVYNIVQFHTRDTAKKGVVLYFHGNRRNVTHYAMYAEWFTRNGYDVWMPDYPGFGKSTGVLTEQALYDEALQVYKLARNIYEPKQIVIYGKSLGTGVAAQLASIRDCRRLLLETPYYSIPYLLRPYLFMYPLETLLHYRIPTYQYLQKVSAPVTIFHGTADGVVPYRNASRLTSCFKPGDELVTIEGGSHNDLGNFTRTRQKLDSILR